MGVLDHILMGAAAVFMEGELFSVFGLPVSITPLMIAGGFLFGILVGATPGLAGPMAMAISLPGLIAVFGVNADALLPTLGFLIGIMKGATVGGAAPAILFNTPGTPDALLTARDGWPMTKKGEAGRALRVAHFSSASGDTISDLALFVAAPFLAVLVESYLDLPEKTALILLSLSFIAAVSGRSAGRGLLSAGLGLLAAAVGTGEDFYSRLTMGTDALSGGFPVAAAVLGVLVVGEVFRHFEDAWRDGVRPPPSAKSGASAGRQGLTAATMKRILPHIGKSALIGTAVGALPGVGSTLAATLGYASGKRRHAKTSGAKGPQFGDGLPEGVAAAEAANSSVSGANLIPVLSLGIPGNTAAVFLILAMDSIQGFNPGPSVFKLIPGEVNPEMVAVFGIFTAMAVANILNWSVGGAFMRAVGAMAKIPRHLLMPIVLLLTLTAIYAQETNLAAVWFLLGFGALGWLMRKCKVSVLPFVIAFILGGSLEQTARQAFAATGGDPLFLFKSPTAAAFIVLALFVVAYSVRRPRAQGEKNASPVHSS